MPRKRSQNDLARLAKEANAQVADRENANRLDIRPNDGIGPIKLGMTRAQVHKFMGPSGRSETDTEHYGALKVCYGPDQKVDFIEAFSGFDTVFLFEGVDVFDTPEPEMVRHVKRFDAPDPQLSKKGIEYLFPKLILSLWSPEGQYDHRRKEDRPIFGTVGIGNADYLATIRQIKGPKDALDVEWPAGNKPKSKYRSAVETLRKLSDGGGIYSVNVGIDEDGEVRLVTFGSHRKIALTDEHLRLLRSFAKLEAISFRDAVVSDKLLAHLNGMKQLKALMLNVANITDASLATVVRLHDLESLYLPETISAQGFKQLTRLKKLERLSVSLGPGAELGLKHLQGMTSLKALALSDSLTKKGLQLAGTLTSLRELDVPVTDAGMKYLTGLTNLRKLAIYFQTKITDASIAHLEKLPRLEKLSAWSSRLSPKGIARLRRTLPKLKVYQ